jgi:lysophospholipase L1-like esterase
METDILVFGDSIAYGAWDKEGGWVSRLKEFLHKKAPPSSDSCSLVYNLSVSGETTEDLLERFDFEAAQRAGQNMVIVFAIGINDLQFIESGHDSTKTLARFKENITELAQTASRMSDKVFFVGLTPLDEKKTHPLASDGENPYTNESVRAFNRIIEAVCSEEKAKFIDIFSGFMKKGHERLLEDGLHPNSDGHRLIFELVRGALTKNKTI